MSGFGSKTLTDLDSLVDWFIPPAIAADKDTRKQARLFLISHIFGPLMGNIVALALYYYDPQPDPYLLVLPAAISVFWAFPFILKAFGHYNILALVSIQNLILCIFWSCYYTGGIASPMMPWVLTIPLLAFFYIGNSPLLRASVLTMFAINFVGFIIIYNLGSLPPVRMSPQRIQILGIVSIVAASTYVMLMSVYYGKALASQVELEAAMRRHMATAAELRKAAAEAERANLAKSEFLARMSHELRTPLNAVIGYSQMLIEDAEKEGDDANASDLAKIHVAGHHLLKLVNNVLDLSKIEAGHMDISSEEFDFASLIRLAVKSLALSAALNGNQLRVMIAPDVGVAYADELKVRNAITNVVENAIKYTQNGVVEISCRTRMWRDVLAIEVRVRDTGAGIDAQNLPTLFEQFAVGDDQSATKYGGTGVGLALTRKLYRLMGGDVTVETELGAGSTFSLVLPIRAGQFGALDTPLALVA